MSGSRGVFVLLAALGLNACATTECDPSRGGFVRGIGCSADGKYSARQQEKQQTLSEEQQRSDELKANYEATQTDQARVRRERQAAERKYAALQDDLTTMREKLAAAKVTNVALENELAALENEVRLLQQDAFTPEADKQARLEKLRRRKELLESEVETATDG